MMQYGNQKIGQIVYVDANGVQHNIKEAYMGGQLVYSAKKKGFTITSDSNMTFQWRPDGQTKNTITLEANVPLFVEVDGLTSMSQMFYPNSTSGQKITALDVSGLDTSNVTDMQQCFYLLQKITSFDVSKFKTSNVTTMDRMFGNCYALTSLDLSNFDTTNVTDMNAMFSGCKKLTSLNLSNFDVSKVISKSSVFNGCSLLTHIKCKQAFKDWCITNATTINLPAAMQEGGSGTWEIVE